MKADRRRREAGRNGSPAPSADLAQLAEILDDPEVGGACQAAGDKAYSVLRRAIISGVLRPGTALAEVELAGILQISRTPVRVALQTLLTEQLVEPGRRRQLIVRSVSPAQGRELFLLRQALESVSVGEAARSMPLDDVDRLRILLLQQRRAIDDPTPARFLDLDDEFHLSIARGAGLPTLELLLGQIRAINRLVALQAVNTRGRHHQVVAEHEAIVDALESRSVETAVEAMKRHLDSTSAAVDGTGGTGGEPRA